jgi:acetyltransferase-like isoleucine patch superfamily enzyme
MTLGFDPNISEKQVDQWLASIREFLRILTVRKKEQFNRRVSVGDLLTERTENAAAYGFGEGTTMYDNVLVRGEVKVGRNTWIGPGCILDGSGGVLQIGDWCSISAGAQIYTHHTVNRSITLGEKPIDCASTTIGNGVYIGPNAIIQMGVAIGDRAIVGANAFVNRMFRRARRCSAVPHEVRPSGAGRVPEPEASTFRRKASDLSRGAVFVAENSR